MSKCPFISREEALNYANWEGAYKVALLIEDIPDSDPKEMIAAAIRQMNSEELIKTYMKLSECLYRSIVNRGDENTILLGGERPGSKLEISITIEESETE